MENRYRTIFKLHNRGSTNLETKNEDKNDTNDLVNKWIQGFHRGSLRFFILHLLLHDREFKSSTKTEQPPFRRKIHGYHIAKVIEQITDKTWSPTTASIYPVLKQFEEEGIIEEISDQNNKEGKRFTKNYQLTDYGVEVAQKLRQARKDFTKAFRMHGPPPRPHFHFAKSILELSDEEISELLKDTSLEDLEREKKQLKESILLMKDATKAIENEIERRRH